MRILIADDELQARKRLQRLLSAMPEVDLAAVCSSGDEVVATLGGDEPVDVDVALLDIRMPGLSGLETKALLGEDGPYVVFVTAHEEHALEAFDVGAVDYLLKPVDAARLARALERARRMLGLGGGLDGAEANGVGETSTGPERLAVETRDGVVLLDPAEIQCAVLEAELVTLWTARGDFLVDQSLQRLEDRLGHRAPGADFVRAHRRVLLNLEQVGRLESLPTGGYRAWFETNGGAGPQAQRSAPVSRQAARALRRRFGL